MPACSVSAWTPFSAIIRCCLRKPPSAGGHSVPPQMSMLFWVESATSTLFRTRRDGRVVEGARLESVYRGNSIEGSNPSLSAILESTVSRDRAVLAGNGGQMSPAKMLESASKMALNLYRRHRQ